MPVARRQTSTHDGLSSCVQRDGRAPPSTTQSGNQVPRHEQLGRHFANSFVRHSNRYLGGPQRNGGRNDLRHRHTIAGRIFLTDESTGQFGIREPTKGTNGQRQTAPGYATR